MACSGSAGARPEVSARLSLTRIACKWYPKFLLASPPMTAVDNLTRRENPLAPEPPGRRSAGRGLAAADRGRWRRRRYVKRAFVWTHRWSSLVLGLLLLDRHDVGRAAALRAGDRARPARGGVRRRPGPPTLSLADALPIVQGARPGVRAAVDLRRNGVYVADDFESGRRVTVDPSNGQMLGDFNPTHDSGVVAVDDEPDDEHARLRADVRGVRRLPGVAGRRDPGTGWLGFDGAARHLGRAAARHHGPAAAVPRALRHLALVAGRAPLVHGRPRALAQGPLLARLRPAPGGRHDRRAAAADLGVHGHGLRVRLRREGLVPAHARRPRRRSACSSRPSPSAPDIGAGRPRSRPPRSAPGTDEPPTADRPARGRATPRRPTACGSPTASTPGRTATTPATCWSPSSARRRRR